MCAPRSVADNESEYEVTAIEKEILKKWKRDFQKTDEPTATKNLALAVDNGGSTNKPKWNFKKFKGKCRNCGIQGHKAADCRKKKTDKKVICYECQKEGHYTRDCPSKTVVAGQTGMFVGMTWCSEVSATVKDEEAHSTTTLKNNVGRYLMDTGASCHVVASAEGLVNLRDCHDQVLIGDNSVMHTIKEGSMFHRPRRRMS